MTIVHPAAAQPAADEGVPIERHENERPSIDPPSDGLGSPPPQGGERYRTVIAVLAGVALLGAFAGLHDGKALGDRVVLDVAVTLGIAGGMLVGVLVALLYRAGGGRAPREASTGAVDSDEMMTTETVALADEAPADPSATLEGSAAQAQRSVWGIRRQLAGRMEGIAQRVEAWYQGLGPLGSVRLVIALGGAITTWIVARGSFEATPLAPILLWLAAGAYLIAAGIAATAARYLRDVDPIALPEAPGLASGARVLGWILVLGALSIGLDATGRGESTQIIHWSLVVFNFALCSSLFLAPNDEDPPVFPTRLTLFDALGSRANPLASVVDTAERQLGIDLRSTWALTVLRQSTEPLLIAMALLLWLSTSLTVVGVDEQALVERLGVPVAGPALGPGLYVRWPWPIDRVFRLPVGQVRAVQVGHEGEEEAGPENVLWAVQHAPNEFTLLLGNGRDLITIDAAVQYRIVDARAWRYHSTNPEDALRALAYRAVMRNTVNHTLAEALSENVVALTERMRGMVQTEADALGLGVAVVGFTVGGMHPPVAVAQSYEGVVSAQIAGRARVVSAQAYKNMIVPQAQAEAILRANTARAEGAADLARAAGEAWSFRALEAQYRASPAEYALRRRLETLEANLEGRPFTVVDSRFLRDGGEIWVDR